MLLSDVLTRLDEVGGGDRLRLHPKDFAALLRQVADAVEDGAGRGGKYAVGGDAPTTFVMLRLVGPATRGDGEVIGVNYIREGSFDFDKAVVNAGEADGVHVVNS